MLIVVAERSCRWLESGEDQVSADISNVVQASKPGPIAKGVALNLIEVAFCVGTEHEAAEHKKLSGKENSLGVAVVVDDAIHQSFGRRHSGTLNESTNVGVKTGGSRVGGPELCV